MWMLPPVILIMIFSFYWFSLDLYFRRMLFIAVPRVIYNFRNPIKPHQSVTWRRLQAKEFIELDQPNIILIVADDLGINDLSGGAGVLTPNIDSIGNNNGVNFQNAYAGQSTCAPSRAAMFTGRFPTKIGFEFTPMPLTLSKTIALLESDPLRPSVFRQDLQHLLPPVNEMAIPANVTTLPEVLKRYGYDNYLIGKWHLGNSKGNTPLDRGFDETLTFPIGLPSYFPNKDPNIVNAALPGFFDEFMRENLPFSVSLNNGPPFKPDEYMTDYLTHRAVDLIHSKKDSTNPFFLALTYNAPHTPLQAKRSDYENSEVAQIEDHAERVYAAMIKALDRGVGEVLDALKAANKYENTIIVFTSDNGGAHYLGFPSVNAPYRGWKCTFYEGGIRVPMMLQWPQLLPKKVNFEPFVSHIDIFATFQAAASGKYSYGKVATNMPVKLEEGIDGVDLLSHLTKLDTKAAFKSSNAIESHPHEYLFWRAGHYVALRYGDWKLQVSDRPDKVSFFNLKIDPEERDNLASKIGFETKMELDDMLSTTYDQVTVQSPHKDSNNYFEQLLLVYQELLRIQSKQVGPLWPSILETAIPLDKHGVDGLTEDDDYIYFVN